MILRLTRSTGLVGGLWSRPLGCWQRFRASSWSLTQPAVGGLRFRPGIPSDWGGRIHYDVRMAPPGEEQITCRLQRRIGWLLRRCNAGPISRKAFPQTSRNIPCNSFELFGRSQNAYAE